MTTYYEAHITLLSNNPAYVEVKVKSQNWKFSKIDGDPVLGDGIKCYATKHFPSRNTPEVMIAELHRVATILNGPNSEVIRRKIELVIYDDRSSKMRLACDGMCPECKCDASIG